MNPPSPVAIQVSDLTRHFGAVKALRGISFEVQPGEFVGLIGHNGAGKTTALRVLTGQLPPTSGTVRVTGIDVQARPRAARTAMGYTPEQPLLYEYLTAREFLEFVAEVRGQGDLEAALHLSKPPVLVFDEALNGLDPPSAARVKEHLTDLCSEGCAVLLSTHVLETVERIAHRVVMLAHGRIVADKRVSDIGQDGLERLFLQRIASSHAGEE